MLNLKFILENKEYVKKALMNRNVNESIFDDLVSKAEERGLLMFNAQQKKAELAKFSKQFKDFKDNPTELEKLKKQASAIKDEFNKLNEKANEIEEYVNNLLKSICNISLDDVPVGKDDSNNVIIACHDNLGRGLVANVKPHYEIAKDLDILDLERAVKLSGTRFVVYKGLGARLTRALANFMIDLHTKAGYEEYAVPVIVKPEILYGTGQLPKFKEDLFSVDNDAMYLIPTSEVPLTNLFNNEIVDLEKPLRLTAFSECFRSEAGSGGKDTKGIIRNHQFKKVELVKITNDKDWQSEFEQMLTQAKSVLEELEIPYREVMLCTGDLGFSSRKTVDLELWLPSEMKYREVSSVSYMGDFQARRAMIRYRDENGDTQYAHTMNGSGIAIDRLVAALLENYQNEDGTISIPSKLIPYMGVGKISK